jgi:nucleoside-diphosphate-sugar epimerase
MNILVTGATGLVGNLVTRRVVFEGHQAFALVRDPARATHIKDVITKMVVADLMNPSSLDAGLRGVNAIVHCAALVGSGRGQEDEYFRINVDGTRALVNAAKEQGVKRIVFMSTAGVYGLNMLKGNVDETMPLAKANGYTNSKMAAEEIIRNSGLEYVILRPYWITGAGDRFLIPTVAQMLLNNTFTYLGDGQQQWSISAIENISAAATMVATHPKAGNQIYNIADETVKVSETVNVIAQALNLPAPTRKASPLSTGIQTFLHQSPDDPKHVMSIDLFFPLWRTMTLNTDKIRKELGWAPKISWQESVKQGTLEWKREHDTKVR